MKDSSVALFKIEKLLEKLEKDIKKHQDKEIYRESEKYMKHAQKTIDLYSLTLDEILSTPGQSNLQRHCSVLKRMFKGMQSQVRSVLKFTLFHFKQRSEKLEGQQNDDDMGSPTNVLDNQNGSLGGLDNRGSPGGSPTDMSGGPGIRNGKTHMTMMLPHLRMSPQNSSPQSLYTNINSARSPFSNNGYSRGDFVLQNNNFNGYSDDRGQWGSLNQFGENEEEDIEMLKFQQEHQRMQEEIDDFLKGKEYVEHISPSKVSSNLKQILRGLEYTTKKVNQIADAPVEGDDDDDFDEPNFGEMSKKIKKAFTQAKVKAVKTIGGLLKANGGQSPRGLQDQALALAIAAAEKEIEEIDPKQDSVDEGDNEELNELRAKFEKIEKEKAENLEKVKILTQENSVLAQDKRQLREKVLELENDIIAIKEMFQTSRLEWADTKAAMKRKFEESQQEWLLKSQKASTAISEPKNTATVSFKVEQHEEKSVASQGEDKEEEEENVAENENNGTEGTPSVKDQGSSQGFSNFAVEAKVHVEVSTPVIASAQKVNISNETKSDTKSDASRKSQPAEQAKKQSSESGKRVSNNDTLISIEKPSSETPPLTQPLRIPLNNDSISEKPKDQQPNQQSNPVTLYQNSHNPNPNPNPISNAASAKTNNSNPKEVMSPRGNIQIRNIKKPNVLPKPVQHPKGRNVVEPKSQQNNSNNSVERVPEKRPNYESKVQQNGSSNSVERMLEKVDKGKKAFERPTYQTTHSVTRIQNQGRYGLELHDRIKTEGEAIDDSIDREINALNMQIYSEPKTERMGTANAIYSRGNINAARQGLVFQEQQKRTYTAGSPRSNRNQDTKGNGSPAFSPKAEFNGGALSKGFRDEIAQSPRQQPNYYVGRANADWAGYVSGDKGVIQSVLDLKDDYWNQMDYSPKGDLKQHYTNFSKDKQVSRSPTVGMDRFGQVMRSKKVIKRKSLEGLDQYNNQYRGLNTFRDRVAEKGKYNFSPLVMDEVAAERLRSEPSSSVRMVFNPKIKAYDLYPESPRSGHYPPQSAYYFESEHSADARFQKHGPQPKTFKVKLTIEECIRQEVLKDTKEPAATKEEAQMRIMYRAMLARAKQQPKVSAWMKKSIQDANLGPLNEDHPVVDYNSFEQFVTNFTQAHVACGENCSHLRDFYAKIGYLTSWNNREVMSVKRAQIGVSTMDGLLPTPKLPGLKKKKKEIEREMP